MQCLLIQKAEESSLHCPYCSLEGQETVSAITGLNRTLKKGEPNLVKAEGSLFDEWKESHVGHISTSVTNKRAKIAGFVTTFYIYDRNAENIKEKSSWYISTKFTI